CPFCAICAAFSPTPAHNSVPDEAAANRAVEEKNCYVVLATPRVVAFLDIMPLAPGHVLVCPRQHLARISDVDGATASELGAWLPVISRAVCKTTGVTDWNVVQNNGRWAAQVVDHVHTHVIPRYRDPGGAGRSWVMFGRGQRNELDEQEGRDMAARLRREIREEL
ncbi:HIT-like protein, partial [Piedraia hortae CBS 480.64]